MMMTSYDSHHDTLSRLNHSICNVTDPCEVYVGPKQLSNDTDDLANRQVPILIPEHMEIENFGKP